MKKVSDAFEKASKDQMIKYNEPAHNEAVAKEVIKRIGQQTGHAPNGEESVQTRDESEPVDPGVLALLNTIGEQISSFE